jgi:hypothetical protein
MTGTEAESPGTSAAHFTPSVGLNFTGSPVSPEEPSWFGPRQLGQFSARAAEESSKEANKGAVAYFMSDGREANTHWHVEMFSRIDQHP